jgi:hypothetical protein
MLFLHRRLETLGIEYAGLDFIVVVVYYLRVNDLQTHEDKIIVPRTKRGNR